MKFTMTCNICETKMDFRELSEAEEFMDRHEIHMKREPEVEL